jgi:putative hydrolase of the HAD superfamily
MKAMLFDFYDTLAHLDPAPIEAGRRELARRAGVAETALQSLWRATSRARMLGTAGDLATQLHDMLSALGTAPRPGLLADLVEHEEAVWRQAAQLYDDTRSALHELRQRGFRLGLISNCSCQAGAVIRHFDFAALVDTLVLSFEVGLAKPDPAIYHQACAELRLAPEDCAFVADGAGGELEAASALGLLTVKIRRPGQRAPENHDVRASIRVESLAQLLVLAAFRAPS